MDRCYTFGISASVKLSASSHEDALEKLTSTGDWEDWNLNDHTSPEEALNATSDSLDLDQ